MGTIVRTAILDKDVFSNPIMTGSDGYVYDHESGNDDDTAAMNEFIKSSPIEISEGNRLTEIMSVIPDFKNLSGSIQITLMTREYPHSREVEEDTLTISNAVEKADTLLQGRQVTYQVGSEKTGTDWRLGVLRMEVQPGGDR